MRVRVRVWARVRWRMGRKRQNEVVGGVGGRGGDGGGGGGGGGGDGGEGGGDGGEGGWVVADH